jgi:chitodextrinase
MWRFLLKIALVISLIALLTQCSVSDKRPGEQAQIPASDTTVTFLGSEWSDVLFKHLEHADRYHGECIKCHDHEPIAGQTHWYCRTCHTAGQDREQLCNAVQYHGCTMTQCHNCHEVKGQNPGLGCMDCHTGGQLRGVDSQAPTIPIGLTATAVSPSQTDLSWTASTDNMGVAGYRIYRGGVYLKPATGTSTSDTGLAASTPYCYRVSAYDAANNESAQSTEVCATTQADTETPTVPTGLTATAASSSQTDLSWTASTDNVGVVGYNIYRGGIYLKSVTGTSTSDTGLTANTLYCYQVTAYDGSGHESNMSTQACASSPVASGTTYPGTPSRTLKGVIDPWNKIDHWILILPTSGNIVINVQAWEGDTSTCCIDYFGDGIINNNRLQSNIHLFKLDGTLVGSSAGAYPGHAPGVPLEGSPRGRNPYLSIISIPAGTYVLVIGNCFLSSGDAWNDGTKRYPEPEALNTDSSVCGGKPWTTNDASLGITIYHMYNINIYFN